MSERADENMIDVPAKMCLDSFDFEKAAKTLEFIDRPIHFRDGTRYATAAEILDCAKKLLRQICESTARDAHPRKITSMSLCVETSFCADDDDGPQNKCFSVELSLITCGSHGVGFTQYAFEDSKQ